MATLRIGQTLRFTAEGTLHKGTVTGVRTEGGRRYAEVTADDEVWLMTLHGEDARRDIPRHLPPATSVKYP